MTDIKLSSPGMAKVLKRASTHAAVNDLAEQIAENVRSQGIDVEDDTVQLPVRVFTGTTDRARASVQIAHPSGKAVQAKYGALTKAAAAAGLKVIG